MVTHDEMESTAEFVTEWWEHAEGRRLLPGEAGGTTVYAVEVWRNRFVAAHVVEMAYIVRCVDSDLTVDEAVELVTRLVVAAPVGMELRGEGELEHPECFLGSNALEPITMSFGEWVKARELAENGGSLSSNIP